MSDEKLFRVVVSKYVMVVAKSADEAGDEGLANVKEDMGKYRLGGIYQIKELADLSKDERDALPWGNTDDKPCRDYVEDRKAIVLMQQIAEVQEKRRLWACEEQRLQDLLADALAKKGISPA